jgi:mannonate dehydratase
MALHPDDPPVDRFWSTTQVLNTMAGLKRYTDLAPSPMNGFTLCQGTLQEAGIDVIEAIRTFGRQGRLVVVELRGVRGTIPHYEETFMDDGDLGLVEVAHVPVFPGDESRWIAHAWSVGYVKALIASVYSEA